MVVALMACVCGADDAQAMERWGMVHEDWLSEFLQMPYGPPTQDVFLAVLGSLNPGAFHDLFREWASLLSIRLKAVHKKVRSVSRSEKHIALDGKTGRGSVDHANGKSAIHTLNAWCVESGLVIGQMDVDSKTNEITAAPELLKLLDIRGATVTMDAMGCQTEIASAVIKGGGNYLLAVKENQPSLYHDIETAFNFADTSQNAPVVGLAAPEIERYAHEGKAHGRFETRTVEICRDLSWLSAPEKWPGLNFFVRIQRERTILSSGKLSKETVYYIGSNQHATAESAGRQIRRHWSIENELHWVLDMAFREDEARHRARNAAKNMTTIRQFALNVIKGDKNRTLGVANSRKMAGWDKNYLINLLTKSMG